jgi:hypothetical protein
MDSGLASGAFDSREVAAGSPASFWFAAAPAEIGKPSKSTGQLFEKISYRIGVCALSAQKEDGDDQQANASGTNEAIN